MAFLFIFAMCKGFAHLLSKLSYKGAKVLPGKTKTYACGEEVSVPTGQHEYGEFFPFAFFFTIAHVATLIMTTAPVTSIRVFVLAFLYLTGVIVGLYILLRS